MSADRLALVKWYADALTVERRWIPSKRWPGFMELDRFRP